MNELCSHCGESLASNWIFCARCGAQIERPEPVPQEHEPTPVTGAFTGTLFGIIALPIALIFGIMLCLTGWGLIIGIPVIILAILAPLAGPLVGMGAAKDKVL
ncbi:MAG TPA: zinc ribbon domain-containing protein [Terracidiphilus sp.]|nr:zinc ribbon domain-containing protein [Terracidiphilus sp.]